MSFLICNKCGGYYELQEGESPDDFSDECECGGNLKYAEYLEEKTIKLKSIGIGVLIILLTCFTTLYIHPDTSFAILIVPIALIIGSFAAAYTSGVKYKQGIVNGVLAAVIAGCTSFVIIIILKFILTSKLPNFNEGFFELTLPLIFVFILIPAFIGFIGSLAAILIKTGKMKLNWKIFGGGVTFTAVSLFFSASFLSTLIGGFLVGASTDGNYWEGIKHGFFTGSFGTAIAVIIALFTAEMWLENRVIPHPIDNIVFFILFLILVFVVGGILGSVGGLVGAVAKKKGRNRQYKSN